MLTPESTTNSPVGALRSGAAPAGAWEPPDPVSGGSLLDPAGSQLGPTAQEHALAVVARTAYTAGVGVLLTAAAVGILHWTGHATKTTDFACWCVAAPLIVCAVCALLVLALPPRQEAK